MGWGRHGIPDAESVRVWAWADSWHPRADAWHSAWRSAMAWHTASVTGWQTRWDGKQEHAMPRRRAICHPMAALPLNRAAACLDSGDAARAGAHFLHSLRRGAQARQPLSCRLHLCHRPAQGWVGGRGGHQGQAGRWGRGEEGEEARGAGMVAHASRALAMPCHAMLCMACRQCDAPQAPNQALPLPPPCLRGLLVPRASGPAALRSRSGTPSGGGMAGPAAATGAADTAGRASAAAPLVPPAATAWTTSGMPGASSMPPPSAPTAGAWGGGCTAGAGSPPDSGRSGPAASGLPPAGSTGSGLPPAGEAGRGLPLSLPSLSRLPWMPSLAASLRVPAFRRDRPWAGLPARGVPLPLCGLPGTAPPLPACGSDVGGLWQRGGGGGNAWPYFDGMQLGGSRTDGRRWRRRSLPQVSKAAAAVPVAL